MKKIAALCIAALGAALLVLTSAPGASAYPDLSCDLSVDRQTVSPGDTFTALGVVKGADSGKPVTWTFRWNGETKVEAGATAKATFTAPKSERGQVISLSGEAHATVDGSERTCEHHIDVTVTAVASVAVSAPGGGSGHSAQGGHGGHGGLLPSTGGPAFWALVGALALLLAGGGALVASRRRGR
jgi:hypothetical protein